MKMKAKNSHYIMMMASLAVLCLISLYTVTVMLRQPVTYDGKAEDVVALMEDPSSYTDEADGAAAVIVKKNLEQTVADNAVMSVVFNFRGYDTMGESFILFTSITGAVAILRIARKKKEEVQHEEA